jgi:hypothetical protein
MSVRSKDPMRAFGNLELMLLGQRPSRDSPATRWSTLAIRGNAEAASLWVAEPPPWPKGVVRPPQQILPPFFFFFFLGKKNVKVVKLPQFESLEGLSVIFETLEVKMQIGEYFRGKM